MSRDRSGRDTGAVYRRGSYTELRSAKRNITRVRVGPKGAQTVSKAFSRYLSWFRRDTALANGGLTRRRGAGRGTTA
jgi:hypothetical protein